MVAHGAGHEPERVVADQARPPDASAGAPHPEPVVIHGEPETPRPRISTDNQVDAGGLSRGRLSEQRRRQQLPATQRGIEPGDSTSRAMAIDRRDLRGPERVTVDDLGVPNARWVAQRLLVERGTRFGHGADCVEPGQLDGPLSLRRIQPDRKLEAERSADLVAEECAERSAVDATYQLADEVPVEQGRFTDRGSRDPRRLLLLESGAQRRPVVEEARIGGTLQGDD